MLVWGHTVNIMVDVITIILHPNTHIHAILFSFHVHLVSGLSTDPKGWLVQIFMSVDALSEADRESSLNKPHPFFSLRLQREGMSFTLLWRQYGACTFWLIKTQQCIFDNKAGKLLTNSNRECKFTLHPCWICTTAATCIWIMHCNIMTWLLVWKSKWMPKYARALIITLVMFWHNITFFTVPDFSTMVH